MTTARSKTHVLVVLSKVICAGLLISQQAMAQFTQQGPKLVASPDIPYSGQGRSVQISADGTTAIVGGIHLHPPDGPPLGDGGAWIWARSGGVWSQQGPKLVGSGAVGDDHQGQSVSLSADGNTAIVGGPDDNGQGAAWIWIRSGGVWVQQGPKLVGSGAIGAASQGHSVSLSADGNTAIVGGPNDNGGAGAAWIWMRSGGVWGQQGAKLVGSGADGQAQQGWSVSMSADGSTAVVGGPGDHNTLGAVWVWTSGGGVWTQQGGKLVGSGSISRVPGTLQGNAVAISGDGNTVIVGGPGDDRGTWGGIGAAWIWRRSNGIWSQEGQKLVGSGISGGPRKVPSQGSAVSLAADGNIAAIGGPGDGQGPDYSCCRGAVWVWSWDGGGWTQRAVLRSLDAAGYQGTSVSLTADGNRLIFGAPYDGVTGAAVVFVAADLTILLTHSGTFRGGDTASSIITVTNSGASPTSGTVTVTETLPAGLTPVAPDGVVDGWNCSIAGLTVTCTRSDALAAAASYPPISVKVNVGYDAPPVVTNTVSVVMPGEIHAANNSATDVIHMTPALPAASVLMLLLLAMTLAIVGVMHGSSSGL